MTNHFLVETVWVMFTYGTRILAGGLAVSLPILLVGSLCPQRILRLALLAVAILVLWGAMWVSAENGYRVWQSGPESSEEAFSDTGPIFFLLAGWLPSLVLLGGMYLALRGCWTIVSHMWPVQAIDTSRSTSTVDRPPDDGNPYQSPGGAAAKHRSENE
jgi:hypothetical protein